MTTVAAPLQVPPAVPDTPSQPEHSGVSRRREAYGLIAILGTLLLLRLPSLAEPTWFSDEGTYADIGYALSHGAHLYVNVWDNKPPGVYWLASLFVTRMSPGLGFALMASLFAAIASVCTWRIARRFVERPWAVAAGVVAAVLMSLPTLDGDLFNAEPAGAAAVAIALLLVVRRGRRRRAELVTAGVALAIAMLFKAVFAVDAAAVACILVVLNGGINKRSIARDVMWAGIGGVLTLGAAAALLASTGSLRPALHVLLTSDTSYVTWSAGAPKWTTLVTLPRVIVPIAAASYGAWWYARRGLVAAACAVIWVGWDLAGVLLSARGFTHYVQQAEPSLCVLAAVIAAAVWRRNQVRATSVIPFLLLVPACVFIVWVPRAETAVTQGIPLPKMEAGNFTSSQLPTYYIDGYAALVGTGSHTTFDSLFPGDLTQQREAIAIFTAHSRPGQTVFVWGSIHWSYILSDRMPAGRYITLNSAYYLERGAPALLLSDLLAHPPAVLIVDADMPIQLTTFFEQHHYNWVPHAIENHDGYWVVPGQ